MTWRSSARSPPPFPDDGVRLDPNAAWSVEEAIRVGRAIEDLRNDYFEDPTWGLEGMRRVREFVKHPDRDQYGGGQFRAARGQHPPRGDRRDPARHDLLGRPSPGLQGGDGARDVPVRRLGAFLRRARHPARLDASSWRRAAEPRLRRRRALPPPRRRRHRRRPDEIRRRRDRPSQAGPASGSSSTARSSPTTPSITASVGGYAYDRDPGRPGWYAVMPERRFADPKDRSYRFAE